MAKIQVNRGQPRLAGQRNRPVKLSISTRSKTVKSIPPQSQIIKPVSNKNNSIIRAIGNKLNTNIRTRTAHAKTIRKAAAVVDKQPHISKLVKTIKPAAGPIRPIKSRRMVSQGPPKKPMGGKLRKPPAYTQYHAKIKKLKDSGVGKVLIIIACGPSVKEAPLELIADHPLIDFMPINQPYGFYKNRCPEEHAKIWPTKFWAFCDHSQYNRNQQAWDKYNGTIINSSAVRVRKSNQIIIRHRGGKGFSKDLLTGYHIGRSSTYAGMQVALWMNYDKIYIFGLDMCAVKGKLHHYGKNPDVDDKNRMARFKSEAEYYNLAAQTLSQDERKKFVICSTYNEWDFANRYSRLDHKEAPKAILEYLEKKQK